jgi:ATP-binding cassette, subfamily B, bacterial
MMRTADAFDAIIWRPADAGELVECIAAFAGLDVNERASLARTGSASSAPDLASLVNLAGLETDPVVVVGQRASAQLCELAPAVIEVPAVGWVGLLDATPRRVRLLTRAREPLSVSAVQLADWLTERRGESGRAEIDAIVAACEIRDSRRERTRGALLRAWAGERRVATAWPLRENPGASFRGQIRDAGLVGRGVTMLASHAAEYTVWILAWWVLGRAALEGRIDSGLLAAWALLLATLVPLRWVSMWARGVFATGLGGLLKQRLFIGALQMNADVVRREGAGGLFGRVVESEAVETLGLNGGVAAALAAVELIAAVVVLLLGAGGSLEVALLASWAALGTALAFSYVRRRVAWTAQRVALTHHLVESMTGHRTRLAQQPPAEWHLDEDAALARYVDLSRVLDRDGVRLTTLIARAWPIIALAGVAPVFLGHAASPSALAITLGGILLAQRALKGLCGGAAQLAGAWIAWRQVQPMFDAAASPPSSGVSAPESEPSPNAVVLDARAVAFRYADRAEPALREVDLAIRRGDRLLLEGESGAGKSSLVGVLAGWRTPTSGSILAGGYDRLLLGDDAWRRRVVAAPQYHENHLVSASLAFNLLMGRRWPAGQSDLVEAETVCRGLGLGPLLDRMPGGLQQVVGETGWQLSQGERGRVFLARALLQYSDVVILDESFAALDPATSRQAIEFATGYAKTLLVVAHP